VSLANNQTEIVYTRSIKANNTGKLANFWENIILGSDLRANGIPFHAKGPTTEKAYSLQLLSLIFITVITEAQQRVR